jgi:hypothetical protein
LVNFLEESEGKVNPEICPDAGKYWGCGLYAGTCPSNAILMHPWKKTTSRTGAPLIEEVGAKEIIKRDFFCRILYNPGDEK